MYILIASFNGDDMNRSPFLSIVLLLLACTHGPSSGSQTAQPQPEPRTSNGAVIITADDIQRSPGMSLEQLLLAHVPGMTMTRAADGHAVMHLRGTNTILGEDEPLVVINGIALGPNAGGSNLTAIDPHEIERIEVLRDAAATALYGIRGANGVILITMKQG